MPTGSSHKNQNTDSSGDTDCSSPKGPEHKLPWPPELGSPEVSSGHPDMSAEVEELSRKELHEDKLGDHKLTVKFQNTRDEDERV